jgi:hypothetical protein
VIEYCSDMRLKDKVEIPCDAFNILSQGRLQWAGHLLRMNEAVTVITEKESPWENLEVDIRMLLGRTS